MATGYIPPKPKPVAPKPVAPKAPTPTANQRENRIGLPAATPVKKVTKNKSSDTDLGKAYKDYLALSAEIDAKTGTKIIDDGGVGKDGGGVLDTGLTYEQQLALQKQQQEADRLLAESQKKTLALDTFRATLGLIFGKDEANKAYVGKLYDLTSGFYKSGSTVDEAMNLALYQAENENVIPEFTSRFKGIFALRDAKQKGAAISVPTIAEFFATEAAMGDTLRTAGLGELATESFLGDIIGKQKSVNEVASLISDVFYAIDYAPKEIKQTLSTYFPGVDRTSLAKAILTGTEGANALSQKVKGVSVMGAAQQYGISVDLPTAIDIANRGYDYNAALTGFGQVSGLGRATTLAEFGGGTFTQEQAQKAVFQKSPAELAQIGQLKSLEEARFQGSTGAAKGAFSTQYLNKSSSAGQF